MIHLMRQGTMSEAPKLVGMSPHEVRKQQLDKINEIALKRQGTLPQEKRTVTQDLMSLFSVFQKNVILRQKFRRFKTNKATGQEEEFKKIESDTSQEAMLQRVLDDNKQLAEYMLSLANVKNVKSSLEIETTDEYKQLVNYIGDFLGEESDTAQGILDHMIRDMKALQLV